MTSQNKSTLPSESRPQLYKTTEVAEIFGVLPSTVRLWIATGDVTATKTPGGQYRISQSEVERLATERHGS